MGYDFIQQNQTLRQIKNKNGINMEDYLRIYAI